MLRVGVVAIFAGGRTITVEVDPGPNIGRAVVAVGAARDLRREPVPVGVGAVHTVTILVDVVA